MSSRECYSAIIGIIDYSGRSNNELRKLAESYGYSFVVARVLEDGVDLPTGCEFPETPLSLKPSEIRITDAGYPIGAIIDFTDKASEHDQTVRFLAEVYIDAQISYAIYLGIGILYIKLSDSESTECKDYANIARIINGKLISYPNLKHANTTVAGTSSDLRVVITGTFSWFSTSPIIKDISYLADDNVYETWISEKFIPPCYSHNGHHATKTEKGWELSSLIFGLFKLSTRVGILWTRDPHNNKEKCDFLNSKFLRYAGSYTAEREVLGIRSDLYDECADDGIYTKLRLSPRLTTFFANQPLKNNLDSSVYGTFERDIKKYKMYSAAIRSAISSSTLLDRNMKFCDDPFVIMVLGAGRGALVKEVMHVLSDLVPSRNVEVYAIEKNPNAVTILNELNENEWKNTVKVVSTDMRSWIPSSKADIIISELLGSFGDNELSPECLCEAMRRCSKGSCISIPESYSSYICPISCARIYHTLASAMGKNNSLEIPYVVKLKSARLLAKPQVVWSFKHVSEPSERTNSPNYKSDYLNRRDACLEFCIEEDSNVHGLAGYFDAVLWKDIKISIVPGFSTPEMYSWFPMFFPIKTPMKVSRGDCVGVNFWRISCSTGVWYEWSLYVKKLVYGKKDESIETTKIHNAGGSGVTWKTWIETK